MCSAPSLRGQGVVPRQVDDSQDEPGVRPELLGRVREGSASSPAGRQDDLLVSPQLVGSPLQRRAGQLDGGQDKVSLGPSEVHK